MNYQDSGVNIELGDKFVNKIKGFVGDTYDSNVFRGVGGFASLYKIDEDRFLASGTDGVGTKVKLAQKLGIHHTIGQDLVAMCVNDIICTGARPLFFLDYFATGKLDLEISTNVVKGIANACKASSMALVGGETAEMPGVYGEGVYDLAGFAVGEVLKEDIIDGKLINESSRIVGIASSGFHSNGFSLVRKLIEEDEIDLMYECLEPTLLYNKVVQNLLLVKNKIQGIAHITGGGFHNVARLNDNFDYLIENVPSFSELPNCMRIICERSNLNNEELYKTFNMGVGLMVITDDIDYVFNSCQELNLKCWDLGRVRNGKGKVELVF